MDAQFKELLKQLYEILKPLGYRKEFSDFRLFRADGLCRIISFQKNKFNGNDKCEFVINVGVCFEKDNPVINRNFKEYDCPIRRRFDNSPSGAEWWRLDNKTSAENLLPEMKDTLKCIEDWFSLFPSKETAVRMILDGTAENYSDTNVMNFRTAEMLVEMGYSSEVYERIKDTKTTYPRAALLIELAEKIKNDY